MDPFRDFSRSDGPTLGVEWEICLVDPVTRDLVPRAAEVIEEVQARYPDIRLEPEFLQNTIELVTPICANTKEAVRALQRDLSAVKEVADEKGLKLWASGGHPFSDFRTNPLSPKHTYEEIVNRTQYWGQHMLLWGIHCHVGISHEDKVWPIINAVMTKYPHLLAISASSPGWDGIDTSYASNRTMLYQQLPTAGMPYQFESWDEWVDFMRDQQTSGVINHTGSMHFDVRPAAKWGTVEVRISDATSNLRELAAVVALTHCLVVHYDRMLERGEKLPTLQQWHVAENKWRGARYGMDALVITSRGTDEDWVKHELQLLIDELTPVAADLDCVDELNLVREIIERGAGYERQRAIYQRTGDWKDVVDATCAEMWELSL
ncbi:Carboxylate-amine ligase YbdK [Corynebacterium afermentans subsp. afermentans]|uniref:Putative glutamate--cysteine ligase 2 n=1 Tax=Corynebacterium afermentans TaxID=38286 RepID=A0A9X8R257_9CORY|nr:glutamate--cysteine ligase [Corynebacterium afermentans]OAA15889.1 carboxylate--amine ligase [Corynebacterium afermentans subsp. afermentans]WJY57495.1 Carboxylate-amine ligase YbdK [Corynebacterium afermentans subsp. afermentans]SIQ09664.1 carboxylate-amine ligase [Corynebacterium afermentans]